jgi:hypothetical protein
MKFGMDYYINDKNTCLAIQPKCFLRVTELLILVYKPKCFTKHPSKFKLPNR